MSDKEWRDYSDSILNKGNAERDRLNQGTADRIRLDAEINDLRSRPSNQVNPYDIENLEQQRRNTYL